MPRRPGGSFSRPPAQRLVGAARALKLRKVNVAPDRASLAKRFFLGKTRPPVALPPRTARAAIASTRPETGQVNFALQAADARCKPLALPTVRARNISGLSYRALGACAADAGGLWAPYGRQADHCLCEPEHILTVRAFSWGRTKYANGRVAAGRFRSRITFQGECYVHQNCE